MTNLSGRMRTRGNILKIPDIVSIQSGFVESPHLAQKITIIGSTYYLASAVMGASYANPVWQAKRIIFSGADILFTWCDGNDAYDNIATDLTALSYS